MILIHILLLLELSLLPARIEVRGDAGS